MILIKNISSLVLIFCSLIRVNDAGCKYTNPQWVGDDPNFMTAPSLHLTFNGVNEEDLVWLSASWNLSYVEKYPQCIDSIQILVKKIKDSKTKKTLLCDIAKPTVMNCTGSLHRKDFCDETLDVWIRITNQDYKDGLQPIGAPSMTRVDNFQCGEPYNLEALGTFMKSQSCESLQPAWKSSPDFIIPEGIRSKRVVNMTWTNSLIENVICVDEVEIKYWEEGAFSKGYHKESVKIVNAGTEDYEYMASSGNLFYLGPDQRALSVVLLLGLLSSRSIQQYVLGWLVGVSRKGTREISYLLCQLRAVAQLQENPSP